MRASIVTGCILLMASLCSAQPGQAPPSAGLLVIDAGRLITGDGSAPVLDARLVVERGRILHAGRRGEVPLPREATGIDLRDKTLMPMLINLHGHVGFFDFADLSFTAEHYTRESIADQLKRHEYYGVAAVLSLGTDVGDLAFRLRDDQRAGKLQGASLFLAGRGFSAPGGGPRITPLQHVPFEVDQPAIARILVRELAGRRVDMIKIWVDDRSGTVPKLDPAVYRAVIEESREQGVKVMAHVFDLADAKDLVRSGVDGFAHLVRDLPVDDELVLMMKARDVFVCPVLNTHAVSAEDDRLAWRNDPAVSETVSARALGNLRSNPNPGRADAARRRRIYANMQQSIKKLNAAGVRIALGVDSGIPNHIAGFNEHQELEYLVASGLTPLQAIASGTSISAAILELDELGTLEPGKRADFIVLSADPLQDIVNTRRIEAVYREGQAIDRELRRKAWLGRDP